MISHWGEEWEPSGENHSLFIFPKNLCLASAIHVSRSIFLLGKLQDRPRSLICVLACWSLANGHLVLFSGYLYAYSQRKKIHFIIRNKNIMERTQVAGGWVTGKDIRNKMPDKDPVFPNGSFWVPVPMWSLQHVGGTLFKGSQKLDPTSLTCSKQCRYSKMLHASLSFSSIVLGYCFIFTIKERKKTQKATVTSYYSSDELFLRIL